jgi:hypothetical protein
MTFIIREVVHRQSSAEGTTTDVMITNPLGLGGLEAYGQPDPQAANPQLYNGAA